MVAVVGILVDGKGNTVGARISGNGLVWDMSTAELASHDLQFENAVVDKNGYVRARRGSLQRICVDVGKSKVARSDYEYTKKLLSGKEVLLYHGNKDKTMKPKYGVGGMSNDYGSGFYTTDNIRLAKEWAWCKYTSGRHGYVHTYKLDITGLSILNYSALDSLHWVAEIISNRYVNLENRRGAIRNLGLFLAKYKLDTSAYDIIVGYRADDSYFDYVADFAIGAIMREDLDNALRLGSLGTQVCIKSEKAFSRLKFVKVEEVPIRFQNDFKNRELQANRAYKQLIASSRDFVGMHNIMDYI